jgi:plasmid stabilization system protein ParE
MRRNFRLLLNAQRDLRDILRYIGQDNFSASVKMRKLFTDAFAKLGDYPQMGQAREDLTSRAVRFWPVHQTT